MEEDDVSTQSITSHDFDGVISAELLTLEQELDLTVWSLEILLETS